MNDLHGILFAYRSDANLGELTRPRNTCSLPFGGRYRLIDFMLSNCVNAGITDIGVVVHQSYQYNNEPQGAGEARGQCPQPRGRAPKAPRSNSPITGSSISPNWAKDMPKKLAQTLA